MYSSDGQLFGSLSYTINSYQLPEPGTWHSVLAAKVLLEIILLGGTKDKMDFQHGYPAVLMETHKELADYPGLFDEPYIKVCSSDFFATREGRRQT
jgi:hypothetical protein